jgi:hypothetical protein
VRGPYEPDGLAAVLRPALARAVRAQPGIGRTAGVARDTGEP